MLSPLVLGANELTGGASVPSAPPLLPTAAAGTVQGALLALGPGLFLTGTLRESGYERVNSGGHEKTVCDALHCAPWNRLRHPNRLHFYLCPFYQFILPLKVKRPQNRKTRRKKEKRDARITIYPVGNRFGLQILRLRQTFTPSLACLLVATFVSCSKGIQTFFS